MYPPIIPPVGVPAAAAEMSKLQARQYFDWFRTAIPTRVAVLECEVRKTAVGVGWHANFSPESLRRLGLWLASVVATCKQEPVPVRMQGVHVASSDYRLTGVTYTQCFDTAIYLGEVLVRMHPQFAWDIEIKGSNRNINYGQAIVRGEGKVPCNPVHLVVTLAHRIVAKTAGPEGLFDLHQIWLRQLTLVQQFEKY